MLESEIGLELENWLRASEFDLLEEPVGEDELEDEYEDAGGSEDDMELDSNEPSPPPTPDRKSVV